MNFLFIAVLLVTPAVSRKLPPNFRKCDAKRSDFNECLTETIPEAIRQIKGPIRQLGLPSLNPLVIPAMTISPGPGPTGFQQNYTNMKVSGFTDISCTKVEFNFEKLFLVMMCNSPGIRIDTQYWFNGTVANVFPIYGNGTAKIHLDKVQCLHTFNFQEYRKKSGRHLKVVNSSLDVTPGHVSYHFENLYDGEQDKLMADGVNLVMNDNWKEIYDDIKPSFMEGFTTVFADLFNRVLTRVPIEDIFINA